MNKLNLHNYHITVEELLKKTANQCTEKIVLVDQDGHRQGPLIRKVIDADIELVEAYKILLNENTSLNRNNHVPRIYYAENYENKTIILEEFCEGITLDKYLKNHNFDLDLLNDLFLQLCRGVNFLHTTFHKPVIHKDIRAVNIIVNEKTKQLTLVDIGSEDSLLKSQQDPKMIDVRLDVYGVGKVLEFMFDGKNWKDKKQVEVGHLYKEIIDKATSPDPKLRYRSIASVIYEYKSAVKGGTFFQRLAENKALEKIGHVWNILLTLGLAYSTYFTLQIEADPFNPNFVISSFGEKFIYCFLTIVLILIPVWFILLYKPSVRVIIKKLPRLRFWHYIIFSVFCCSAVLIVGLIAQIIY